MFKRCMFLAILVVPCFSCMAHTTLAEKLVNRFWTAHTHKQLDRLLSHAFQAVYSDGSLNKHEKMKNSSHVLSYSISHMISTRTQDQIIVSYYVTSRQQSGDVIYDFNGYRADVFTKVHGEWKMVLHTVLDSVI